MLCGVSLARATIDGALIAAVVAILSFIVAQAGSAASERRRERLAAIRHRDQAIAELLASVVDLITGIQAVRAAYQGQAGWREHVRRMAVMLSAFGVEYGSPKALQLEEVLEWRRLGRFLAPLLAELNRMEASQRLVVTDLASILLPRTNRFYSAVATLTLGPDERVAGVVRQLTPAIGVLVETMAARRRKYERARRGAERALGDFRSAVDALR